MMQGNSHKNQGLLRWLGRPDEPVFPAHPDDAAIDEIAHRGSRCRGCACGRARATIARAAELADHAAGLPELLGWQR